MLAVLVADLGYLAKPAYGHTPLRHQFAWKFATDGRSPADVADRLAEICRRGRAGGAGALPGPLVWHPQLGNVVPESCGCVKNAEGEIFDACETHFRWHRAMNVRAEQLGDPEFAGRLAVREP